VLVVARLLQGASASLLAPASFAMVSSAFALEDRGRALALWAGVAGAATVAGPLVGGILVDHAGWSWVFWINVPLALAAVIAGIRFVPARQVRRKPLGESLDLGGAGTCLLGLGLLAYGVIEGPSLGFHRLRVLGSLAAGVLLLVAFTVLEARREHPMLPLHLFRIREFAVASLTTLLVYAALTAALLLAVLELQEVAGYTALGSGAALVPVTLLILLSPRIARALAWAEPRRLMVTGALLAALGALLLVRVSAGASYFGAVLPACVVLGLGLAVTVAPLTSTVLGSVPSVRAGVASEVNSMVARLAGLAGVAAIPVAAGLGARPAGGAAFTSGFHRAMVVAAVLCVAAAAVALLGLRSSPGDGAAA
jgi:predicted MFS family arabinose efflux permease